MARAIGRWNCTQEDKDCLRSIYGTLPPSWTNLKPMTNLLILLTLPEPIRGQYRDRLMRRFPALNIQLVDHHTKVGPHIGSADALLTFAPMLSDWSGL